MFIQWTHIFLFFSNFHWSPSLIMSRVRWTIFTFFISFSLRLLNLYTVDEPYGLITVDYSIRCVIDIYNKMVDRSCQFGAKSRQVFCDISHRTQTFSKSVPILLIWIYKEFFCSIVQLFQCFLSITKTIEMKFFNSVIFCRGCREELKKSFFFINDWS